MRDLISRSRCRLGGFILIALALIADQTSADPVTYRAGCPTPPANTATYQVDGIVNTVDPFPVPFAIPGDPFT